MRLLPKSTPREAAKAEGRPQIFLSPWRNRDPKDAPKDVKPTVRLKAPRDGETIVIDHVQGHVTFPNKDLDDLIILRSDGNPTYNLAVVVDDHDMGVTHVVRGVDHLTNTARQTQIYLGLGWQVPTFAWCWMEWPEFSFYSRVNGKIPWLFSGHILRFILLLDIGQPNGK